MGCCSNVSSTELWNLQESPSKKLCFEALPLQQESALLDCMVKHKRLKHQKSKPTQFKTEPCVNDLKVWGSVHFFSPFQVWLITVITKLLITCDALLMPQPACEALVNTHTLPGLWLWKVRGSWFCVCADLRLTHPTWPAIIAQNNNWYEKGEKHYSVLLFWESILKLNWKQA